MKMKVFELLNKYAVLKEIELAGMSKDLKVKVVSMRIEYGKINRDYESDFQEFAKTLITPEFEKLRDKEDKTEEENKELQEKVSEFNNTYNKYYISRINEEVEVTEDKFTEDELKEIIETNSEKESFTINGNKISTGDFLENIYMLFI